MGDEGVKFFFIFFGAGAERFGQASGLCGFSKKVIGLTVCLNLGGVASDITAFGSCSPKKNSLY